ncbi:MAG: hypothetical protein AVDCRST_MAG64-4493, partial [uncultured Phycisphaerae bacterium]
FVRMAALALVLALVLVLVLVLVLACGDARAEIPSLPKERLTEKATLVVTGKVTAVDATVVREGKDGSKETRHTLTVNVADVAKGEWKDRAKPIRVIGHRYVLPPRATGSAGHRSDNTRHSIADVAKGWELRLYLAAAEKGAPEGGKPADGKPEGAAAGAGPAYPILLPNGFGVLKEAK